MLVLVLRSYGDYIILLNSIRHSALSERMKIITSKHLEPLHEAIGFSFSNNFEFIFKDFGIKKGILRYFTNKYFLSFNTILELVKLKKVINQLNTKEERFYLEHKSTKQLLNFLLSTRTRHIYKNGNVYDAFREFFKADFNNILFNLPDSKSIKKILIFPDSRKKSKVIDVMTMKLLTNDLNTLKVDYKIANFGNVNYFENKGNEYVVYKDFKELITLINNCDFIISSDSLPVHIAEFFEKPHLILYNKKINHNWLTPFAIRHNMYSTFENASILLNSYFKRSC